MKLASLGLALGTVLFAQSVQAQSFVDTGNVTIGDTTLCPGAVGAGNAGTAVANVSRTFNVSGLPTLSDLNVGLIADHTWRGDMRVTLISPPASGPISVELITEDTSNAGNVDDYNIQLDDEAAVLVNAGTTGSGGPHDTAATPYQWNVRPDNLLSAFDGIDPNGTWTLNICDDYQGQSGTYRRSELIFAQVGTADLSLAMTAADSFPEIGTATPLTLTLTNGGPETVTSTVAVNLPAGVDFDSASGDGSYDNVTGIWTPPSNLASGTSAVLTLNVIVTTNDNYTITTEVASAGQPDPDSTPNNGSTTEDDDAEVSLFGQPPPTPPNLTCPIADRFTHAWTAAGANSWPAGASGAANPQSYPPTGTAVPAGEERLVFTLTGDINRLGASNGANTPVVQTQVTGGTAGPDPTLSIAADYAAQSESVLMEIDVGEPGTGVDSIQFQIFDVDLGGWIDRITVTGSLDGVSQPVTLTRSGANFISGNSAIGRVGSGNTTSGGNVTVTFLNPVDNVQFVYDNHPDVGANPAFQIIALHEITTCPRTAAELSAVKTVEVNDPGGLGLYMTPGNEVLYKIIATNAPTATANAQDVDITDTLPPNLKFISASTTGFVGGSFGSPALPAVNQDCGTTPCVVRFSGAEVPIGTTAEVIVIAEIK